MSNKLITAIYTIGYLTVIVSTILCITDINWAAYPFAAGAALTIIGRGLSLPKGDFNTRRLNIILALGALSLMAAAYFMFKGSNSWAVMLLIFVIVDLYTSFRHKG